MISRLLDRFAQRSPSRVYKAAAATVRERLASRGSVSCEEIIALCHLSADRMSSAKHLLVSLAHTVGVECGKFRPEDRFSELFTVPLDPQIDDKRPPSDAALPLHVFAYEIFAMLQEISDRSSWAKTAQRNFPDVRDEEQWIDEIMEMTLCGFLTAFAPVVRAA
jgi:hypothetical protein